MKEEDYELWRIAVTWMVRILVGGLFIFSGFVKAVDPWGTLFKIEEYLGAFGFALPFMLTRLIVFALCSVEFVVGVFVMIGCYRRTSPLFAGLIMMFMLPLSLWIAVEDPVADCGCFGDAWHVSNWFTFWKNIILVAGIAWLIRFNKIAICLITPAFQWLAVVFSGVFIVLIELIGFFYQPLIDFRDFPVGSSLFATDEEDGLDVFDPETADDLTEYASQPDGEELIVMIPKVSMVSPATTWKLNTLYEWALSHDVKMIAVVSGSQEEIKQWEDLSMASYPIFLADDSAIKTIVRGNPGVVFLKNGKILWKSTLGAIDPDEIEPDPETPEDFSNDYITVRHLQPELDNILERSSILYLIGMAFLVMISFTPRLARLMTRSGLASKRGIRN